MLARLMNEIALVLGLVIFFWNYNIAPFSFIKEFSVLRNIFLILDYKLILSQIYVYLKLLKN